MYKIRRIISIWNLVSGKTVKDTQNMNLDFATIIDKIQENTAINLLKNGFKHTQFIRKDLRKPIFWRSLRRIKTYLKRIIYRLLSQFDDKYA